MTDTAPVATVEGRPASAALADRSAWAASIAVAVAVAVGATVVGVPPRLGGPFVLAAGVGVVTLCVLVGATALRDTAAVRFYRDRVVTEARVGPFGETASVPFEDVDLVVREDEPGSEEIEAGTGNRTETGTFELLRSGQDPVTVRNVRDPAAVERILDGRVPSPRERETRASADSGFDRAIEHERTLWRRWPSDRPLPDSAVVAAAGPAAALDGRVDVRSRSVETGRTRDTVENATVEELARGQHRGGGNTGDPLSDGNITDPGTPGAWSGGGGMGGTGGGGAVGGTGDGGDGGGM